MIPGLPKTAVGSTLILTFFVPPLVFEAALGLDLAATRGTLLPISLLATLGVALSVLLIGLATHLLVGLDWGSAFLLGAILSPTDPIAVVALVRMLGAPARLAALMDGESLFNDGTGIAVFAAVLASIGGGSLSVGDVGGRLLGLVAGGVLVGSALGLPAGLLLRRRTAASPAVALTLAASFGSYLLAARLGFSGVVAVVASALLVAHLTARSGSLQNPGVVRFWAVLGFGLNAALFFLVGEELPGRDVLAAGGLVLAVFAIMLLTRAVPVYLLLGIADPLVRRLPWRWRHLAFWGGVRGALSIALALAVAGVAGVDGRVPTLAYGVVVLSLLIQGGLLEFVFRRLGFADLAPPEGEQAPEP